MLYKTKHGTHKTLRDALMSICTMDIFREWKDETEEQICIMGIYYGAGTLLKSVDYVSFCELYSNYIDNIVSKESIYFKDKTVGFCRNGVEIVE